MPKRRVFLWQVFGVVWLSCVLVFLSSFAIATNWFKGTVVDTTFGSSREFFILVAVSFLMGVASFILAVFFYVLGDERNANNKRHKNKSLLYYAFKFGLFVVFLPLVLLIQVIRPKQTYKLIREKGFRKAIHFKSLLLRVLVLIPVLLTFMIWAGGYALSGVIVGSLLGYVPEDILISGTGSMHPTWPKGTKGKSPKELGKEIVSSAGFLPYPNGLVIAGNRILNYEIGRGDIVTAENEKIKEITQAVYGEPSGVLKRVVAVGGDTIELKDGVLYLNDQPQKEQYTSKARSTFGESFLSECEKYTVPDDSVFLMGDNRKGSSDSREFGPVKYGEIDNVLPLKKQKGVLDQNWRDTSKDLDDVAKPKIDKKRFVELLNGKRKENNASPVKHEPKLDVSAAARGTFMLNHNSFQEEVGYDIIVGAMSRAGYWNSYVWEWTIEGYYEADELVEDYIERDSSDAKNVWFDKKFDDIGVAEVSGILNGCPTQIIVIHAAGYIPPNYKQSDIDSWQQSLDSLKSVRGGWADLKNYASFYEQHKSEVDRINELINIRIARTESILSTMRANKWLSSEQNKWAEEDQKLYQEMDDLATRLNSY